MVSARCAKREETAIRATVSSATITCRVEAGRCAGAAMASGRAERAAKRRQPSTTGREDRQSSIVHVARSRQLLSARESDCRRTRMLREAPRRRRGLAAVAASGTAIPRVI